MNRSSVRRKYNKLAYKVYKNAKICVKCYSVEKIEIHHKNEDIFDNSEKNLQILCSKCHRIVHHKWKIVSEETKRKISETQKKRMQKIIL